MARQSRRIPGAHRIPRAARIGPAVLLLALGCGTETPAGGKAAGTGSTGAAGTTSSGTAGSGGDAGASVGAAGTGLGAGGTSAGTSNSGGAGGAGGVTDASAPTGGGQGGNAGTGGAGGSSGAGGTSSSDGGTGCMGKGNICWDFETGQTPTGWAPITNQGTGSIAVDNTKAHGGMFALHVKGSGSNPMHSLGSTLPPNFGGTMWGRVYLFLSPQGPGDHGATFKARYADATDTAPFTADKLDWYETGLGHGVYETIWHKPQPPSGLPEWEMISNTKVTLNQWFCEEWLFDGVNGTNPEAAEPRMWIDGTELAFPDKHIYPGGAPKPPFTKAKNFILIEVGLIMYHPLTVATDLWMDDLVIGPERIGCN